MNGITVYLGVYLMSVIRDSLDWSWPVGKSDRIRECDNCIGLGNSKAVQITRKEDGFLWHCFRCTLSGFYSDDQCSPEHINDLLASKQASAKQDSRPEVVELPMYADKIVPQALVDMYDVMIEPDDIDRFNIGWSPVHKRTIFPLYKYGSTKGKWARKLTGWAGKKLSTDDSDKPKWSITRQRDIKHPRFIAVPEQPKMTMHKQVVLVEDPHSAIRIAQLNYMAIGLLTTYLPYELYPVLRGWEVKIWLDLDAYSKACKYQAKLGSNGISAEVIMTDKDPKHYTPEEIEEELKWQT